MVHILQPGGAALAAATDSASVTINGSAPVPVLTGDGCHLLATIEPGGASPVQGLVSAKVWKESSVPVHNGYPIVSRHYQVMPSTNSATATARVTLYFTQQEFDDFNAHSGSTTDLPANAGDTAGVAKLRIAKYPGVSSDNSGLPASYAGTPVLIDPADGDIQWNETLARWEVSFDVTGFSGFVVQTSIPVLPLTLIEFKGRLADRDALLSWKTADEINTRSFDIERSLDGQSFSTVGNRMANGQPGVHTYGFADRDIASLGVPTVYYRLKPMDIDGRFTYSQVIALGIELPLSIRFTPNPAGSHATLVITGNESMRLQARITDNLGRAIRTEQWTIAPGSNVLPVPLEKLMPGFYYLEVTGEKVNQRISFLKFQ
jgi:hypothetical protein